MRDPLKDFSLAESVLTAVCGVFNYAVTSFTRNDGNNIYTANARVDAADLTVLKCCQSNLEVDYGLHTLVFTATVQDFPDSDFYTFTVEVDIVPDCVNTLIKEISGAA